MALISAIGNKAKRRLHRQQTHPDRDNILKQFQHFDLTGDGYIERDEFGHVLRLLDDSWTWPLLAGFLEAR